MDDTLIQSLIAKLSQEDDALEEAIRQLGIKRTRVQQAKASLTALLAPPDEPVEFEGKLADAVRAVLKKATRPLSPVEVRDELKTINYDLTKHSNALASVHSVLRRMAESEAKEVKQHSLKEGTKYSWIAPPPKETRAMRSMAPTDSAYAALAADDHLIKLNEVLQGAGLSQFFSSGLPEAAQAAAANIGGLGSISEMMERLTPPKSAVEEMIEKMQKEQEELRASILDSSIVAALDPTKVKF